jgi:hypothetical protein
VLLATGEAHNHLADGGHWQAVPKLTCTMVCTTHVCCRDGLMKVGRPLDPPFPGGPTTLKAIPNYSLTGGSGEEQGTLL